MPRLPLSLAVVGADHPNKRGPTRRFGIALCTPGDPIELRPEPKNPADEYAVAVYTDRGIQIGYLTAERAPWFSKMLGQGREISAVFQESTIWGAVIRVAFDGERPTLPAPTDRSDIELAADDDAGFWPDPIYDD